MSARMSCLECLVLAWYAITSSFRNAEPANPEVECPCKDASEDGVVALVREREPVTTEKLREVMSKPIRKLTLTNCRFDGPISSEVFCCAALDYLEIYSPGGLQVTDDLSALAEVKSLRTLKLIRTDFVNADGGRCYAALARMTQLEELNLDRTITLEKAPGQSVLVDREHGSIRCVTELDPIVMDSLERLLTRGNLKTLSLRACTALRAEDVERLRTIRPNCEIVWKPSNQVSNVQASSHQGSTQRASAKEHKE
jgi:hypothetical protein